MLGSQSPIYEVVTGDILLSKRFEFYELHRDVFLPITKDIGITPVLLLVTEIGRYCRFIDVFKYDSLIDYGIKTDRLVSHPDIKSYHEKVGQCILGSIQVELALEFPYAKDYI